MNSNGVIRIGKKGVKKFAFGDDGAPFEVDVVVVFQQWVATDEGFRDADFSIPSDRMLEYHAAAVSFVQQLCGHEVTTAEALDFIARLREQYDEVAAFFRPKSREERASLDTSEAELRFSAEES